jgi:MurNAc alpha-1-phosphate uridylyltransferase
MILAAGFGLRLRPITDTTPKPLVQVLGRTLIDRTIDRLHEGGVESFVVNTHHLSELIHRHLKKRVDVEILFSLEDEILETGGGITNALSKFSNDPFFACNGDTLWLNGSQDAVNRMVCHWDENKMDALLMLHSTVDAYGYEGLGDFDLDPLGVLSRRPESEVSPYLFTGVQILHPRLFEIAPKGPFSMNVLYDKAIKTGRLYGIVHDGEWFHVGTPEALNEAEDYMRKRYSGIKRR